MNTLFRIKKKRLQYSAVLPVVELYSSHTLALLVISKHQQIIPTAKVLPRLSIKNTAVSGLWHLVATKKNPQASIEG